MRSSNRLWLTAVSLLLAAGCSSDEEREREQRALAARSAPSVAGVIELSDAQRQNLGLVVAKVARREVGEVQSVPGELQVPPGREIAIRAPMAGFFVLPDGAKMPQLGQSVEPSGQPLAHLQELLPSKDQADLVAAKREADMLIGQSSATIQRVQRQLAALKDAKEAVAGAKIAELEENLAKAKVSLTEAKNKLPFLPKEPLSPPLRMTPITLSAPLAGRIVKLSVQPGQLVLQGDELMTVADWSTLWVQAPVFEADAPQVLRGRPATLSIAGQDERLSARFVDRPQPNDPQRRVTDLFYEVDNPDWTLRPGQTVMAALPTAEKTLQLVIPRSAIVWDAMGNAWVYVEAGAGKYRRCQVEPGPLVADGAVIERGLKEGEPIVVTGAESLYGQEFKSQIPVTEED